MGPITMALPVRRISQPLRAGSRDLARFLHASSPSHRTSFSTLSERVQIYRSPFADPYVNLSIEHHLLQRSHPDSTVLFLYVNDPCVVIGRNQNPWLEVNLRQLRIGLPPAAAAGHASSSSLPVSLVRRRSGGGTVFHDHGNVNWSVICPPAAFDRDKHAEMVVRALTRLGVPGARVNVRHDIVQDVADAEEGSQAGGSATFKVSGSAYKLTRLRSLHHGTCLLASPHLARVGALLRSPAEPYIKARGVESVRSPIKNLGVDTDAFRDAVVDEFRAMYGGGSATEAATRDVVSEMAAAEDVEKGVRELRVRRSKSDPNDCFTNRGIRRQSPEWIYGQTPQFTFSTHPTEDDPRERPTRPEGLPADVSNSSLQPHLFPRMGNFANQLEPPSSVRYYRSATAKSKRRHSRA